jgi:hypothetical protein
VTGDQLRQAWAQHARGVGGRAPTHAGDGARRARPDRRALEQEREQ